jgi:hypothetical protein
MATYVGSIWAQLDARLDNSGFQKFERQLADARVQAARGVEADVKAHVDTRAFRDFNREMQSLRNVVSIIKWPALIAGAGQAAQAPGAVGAAGVAVGSALAPLAGAYAGVASGFLAIKQGAGVAKLAFNDIEKGARWRQKSDGGADTGAKEEAAAGEACNHALERALTLLAQVGRVEGGTDD